MIVDSVNGYSYSTIEAYQYLERPKQDQQVVMIVHDKEATRRLLALAMLSKGYFPVVAKSAEDGLKEWSRRWSSLYAIALFIHKDIGGIGVAAVIEGIRQTAGGELIRTIIPSGEWMSGGTQYAKNLGADAMFDPTGMHEYYLLPNWIAEEVAKGYLSPQELEKRGKVIRTTR